MIGQISRWGTKGYGFVRAAELESEAWLHAKFLEDPEYQPRAGDTVEFTPERLPDGKKWQARKVRLVSSPYRSPAPQMARQTYGDSASSGFAVKLSLGGFVLPPSEARAPERTPERVQDRAVDRPAERPIASLAAAERGTEPACDRAPATERLATDAPRPVAIDHVRLSGSNGAHAASHAASAANEGADSFALSGPAPTASPPLPADSTLAERLAAGRSAREQEIAQLSREAEQIEAQLASLSARLATVKADLASRTRGGVDEDEAIVATHALAAADDLERGLGEQQRRREAVSKARGAAIQRTGLPPVEEYEALRARLREATSKRDDLAEKAFRTLERASRSSMPAYGEALDRLESALSLRARFTAFATEHGITLVAPVRAQALTPGVSRGDDVAVRVAIAFFHAAERAARELGGTDVVLEHGRVLELLAVRCKKFDAGLFPLLLDEAWAARPALLQLGVEPRLEVVDGIAPPWEMEPPPGDEVAAPSGSSRSLLDVAARLGLSLHDLVALAHDHGLPFANDEIDAGTEETIRALLGGAPERDERRDPSAAHAPDSTDGDGDGEAPLLGAADAASRMLAKLLRDRRVGGRHTRVEHAYGHHFSDEEKDLARRVAEWLEKDGIFLPKLNEGAHHISINPRRLRDVGQIIEGAWERRAELDAIA